MANCGRQVFAHEAAAVDPITGIVYLTEDDDVSRLYRFLPRAWGDLSGGQLEAATVEAAGNVGWVPASDKKPYRAKESAVFARGEGAWLRLACCTSAPPPTTESGPSRRHATA